VKSEKNHPLQNQDAHQQPKKPYAAPHLTVHGTVENITGNIGLKNTDGLTGSSLM
jgi:hypothetical protein